MYEGISLLINSLISSHFWLKQCEIFYPHCLSLALPLTSLSNHHWESDGWQSLMDCMYFVAVLQQCQIKGESSSKLISWVEKRRQIHGATVGAKHCLNIVRSITSCLYVAAVILVSVCHEPWGEGEKKGEHLGGEWKLRKWKCLLEMAFQGCSVVRRMLQASLWSEWPFPKYLLWNWLDDGGPAMGNT